MEKHTQARRGTSKHARKHWIGIREGWQDSGDSFVRSLVSLTPSQLRAHAYIVGATGCGKTTLIHQLMAQDLALEHSFVVFDPRGDLVITAIELCQGQVDPSLVKIIDLRNRERPFGFDPLQGEGEPYFRALGVHDAIARESESWGVQLAETLRNGLMVLATCREPITRLESLFYDRKYRSEQVGKLKSESLREFWLRFEGMSTTRQGALAMPVMNKVSLLLATDTLRRVLSHQSPIDLHDHLNRRGSVTLVSLAVDELHGAGQMMGNMILASICREIFSRIDVPESQRNPIRLYADEFENFEMRPFESILAEGRRFGLSLVASHQTLAQLSNRMRSILLNNVGTKLVFRVGRKDSKSMSDDLFGDAQAHDFTEMKTGRAMLWRRERETVAIEVNEPLVQDVGSRSDAALKYLTQVYKYAGSPPSESTEYGQDMAVEGPCRQSDVADGNADLESWL